MARFVRFAVLLSLSLLPAFELAGQPVVLGGAMHPRVRREDDRGPVGGDQVLNHLAVIMRRTPAQSAALDRLLEEQQDPSSPNFHKWLTPEEFGERFGADTNSLTRVSEFLKSEGFSVESVARGRGWILFSGTAAQAAKAFRTEIHRFQSGSKLHFAPAAPLMMPAEIGALVSGIRGLDDFYPEPPHPVLPMYTAADGTQALAPEDLAVIYDANTLDFTGRGQKIAVIGQSTIDLADIRKFRSTFHLPANDPQTVLVGVDPGKDHSGGLLEADADLEWAGALAYDATIIYVYGKDVLAAAQEAIDRNLAPILTLSYGGCERFVPATDAAAIREVAKQANAQGITWISAAGDTGAAGCDVGTYPAKHGLSVIFPASLPEVTAVGGTEFKEDLSLVGNTWPEEAWNESSPASGLRAGGGGLSMLYPKPAWQSAPGVPRDNARSVPDLAFSAAIAHNPYVVASGGQLYGAGGTSLSSPVFASILALAEQSLAENTGDPSGLGNINPSLYAIVASGISRALVHDITKGDNIVACAVGTPDCVNGSLGYSAGPGYDNVTGLGSLDAQYFVKNFRLATTTTLSVSASQVNEGAPITLTVTVREFNGNVPSGQVTMGNADGTGWGWGGSLDAAGTLVATITLPPGVHSLTAKYLGNPTGSRFLASTSSPVTVLVVPNPPEAPALSAPSDAAAEVSVSATLSWNEASTATYDVYFGTSSPPPFWGTVTTTHCHPSGLVPNTTYYWKVTAKNMSGSADSAVRSFTTSGQVVYRLLRVAGSSDQDGFSGDGGPATQAQLSPVDLALSSAGDIYVADSTNRRVRKITSDGLISTIAGTGTDTYSGDGGRAINAGLGRGIAGIAVDRQNNIYLSFILDHRIRMISPDGIISTIAGTGDPGYSGDGGPAINAQLNGPDGIATDSAGRLYVADNGNNCVRSIAAGMISTVAGQCGSHSGPSGNGGPAMSANLAFPVGVAVDTADNLYIAEASSGIRQVANGIITAFAGYGYGEDGPALGAWVAPVRLAVDSANNLYFSADGGRVRKISNGILTTIAGDCCGFGVTPADGLPGTSFNLPATTGIAVEPDGKVLVAGGGGYRANYIWSLTPSFAPPVTSIASGGLVNAASFLPGPVAAGSIASAFGTFALNAPSQALQTPLPAVLSGLSIGIQTQSAGLLTAPLFYASAGQVNLQIPWELAEQASAPINSVLNGISGPATTVRLAQFAPSLFAVNSQGTGQGAILDSAYRLVDSTNPAAVGSVVQIYCTGLGEVTNRPATGSPASGTSLSSTTTTPSVSIGGVPTKTLFSGLAPGTVGEYQVNVEVPAGVAPGSAVLVTLQIGNTVSNTVTMAIR